MIDDILRWIYIAGVILAAFLNIGGMTADVTASGRHSHATEERSFNGGIAVGFIVGSSLSVIWPVGIPIAAALTGGYESGFCYTRARCRELRVINRARYLKQEREWDRMDGK